MATMNGNGIHTETANGASKEEAEAAKAEANEEFKGVVWLSLRPRPA